MRAGEGGVNLQVLTMKTEPGRDSQLDVENSVRQKENERTFFVRFPPSVERKTGGHQHLFP